MCELECYNFLETLDIGMTLVWLLPK
uniref:Uncharacterized protein n=1 Tax=Arundo donax TaxID=35708 RepID=A0A0A8ZBT2_ARUDO